MPAWVSYGRMEASRGTTSPFLRIWLVSSPPTCSRIATMLLARPLPRPSASRPVLGSSKRNSFFIEEFPPARCQISAKLTSDGKLAVKSLSGDEIPNAILFERRGERVGYRLTGR